MTHWYLLVAAAILFLMIVFIQLFRQTEGPALRVLMYHKISADGKPDFLTVLTRDLARQFEHLRQSQYTPILFSDLVQHIQHDKPLPDNPILITFDDGYRDNYTVMYPLLKEYGMKANIFLVPSYLMHEQNTNDNLYLKLQDIQAMDPTLVEFGLHSFQHTSYKDLTPKELSQDLALAKDWMRAHNIAFQPCLAFPYGAYPRNNPVKQNDFFETLASSKILAAFRIGNRLNPLPLKEPLLLQRLDIRGDDPPEKFEKLLRKGKRF